MTSTPVSDVSFLNGNVGTKNQNVSGKESQTESFTSVMSKTSKTEVGVSQPNRVSGITAGTKEVTAKKDTIKADSKETTSVRDDKTAKADVAKADTKAQETTKDALDEKAKELTESIAKELGVEEKDVVKAMEELGLSPIDLFSPENLTAVIMNVTGTEGAAALLTNEGLYDTVQNLTALSSQMLSDVANELQLTPEELSGQLELLKNSDFSNALQNAFKTPDTEQTQTERPETTVNVETQSSKDNEAVTQDETKQSSEETVKLHVKVPENGQKGNEAQTDNGQQNLFAGQDSFQQTAGITEATTEPAAQFHSVTTQEIVDQIMDYIKVEVKPDMSQLEMQLHPESLGTLNVHVANKNGVVTAQFTTQDESVKAAIESQLIQLKESFDEQGIKVQAIEVNVAAKEFERNLDQNGQEKEQSEQEMNQKKGPRRINLKDLDFEGLEAEDEDDSIKIAADMMTRNGNTLDYMV